MQTLTVKINPAFISFVRPSDHSIFSPSAADRWILGSCPFSVNYCKDIPNESSKYSEEGTLAHSLCEALFRKEFYMMTIPAELMMKIAMSTDDNGTEMFQCAHQYVEILSFWLANKEIIGDVIWFKLEAPTPVFPDKGCFGTSDCIIVGTKAAVIIDFKYGKGKNVKADTLQCKVYAAGLARYLENVPEDYKIHIVIHQPRTDIYPKEHVYSMQELYHFLGVIWESILASEKPNLVPNEGNHCYWCPAKRTKLPSKLCPSITQKQIAVAEEKFHEFLADMNAPVESLTAPNPKRDQAILKLHTLFPIIKDIVESTTAEIEMRIKSGEYVDGFSLEDEVGRREIVGTNDQEKAQAILSKFPNAQVWKQIPATTKLRTLSEIEKDLGKNKLDVVCTKKVVKKVKVQDEAAKRTLGLMNQYAQMITNGSQQGE